jgi:MFS family permease
MQVVSQQMVTPIVVETKQLARVSSIYLLSFIQVFFVSLFSIALPNILIFDKHISAEILGIATSAYAFAYLMGPIILRRISQKLGIQRSFLMISVAAIIYVGVLILTLNVAVLFVAYILDGLFTSIFWSNMNNAVARWQKGRPVKLQNEYFRKFCMSWNLGAILGEVIGFIIVFLGRSDMLALILSWGVVFILIPLSLRFKLPKELPKCDDLSLVNKSLEGSNSVKTFNHVKSSHQVQSKKIASIMLFPMSMMLVGECLFQVTKSLYNFTFPFIVYSGNVASYWIYLVTFLQQIAQMGAIYISSHRDMYGKFRLFMIGFIGIIGLTILSIMQQDIIMVFAVISLLGFFAGFLYSFSAQLQMNYSAQEGTLKYASMYESISGVGFGLTPLIAGLIVLENPNILFYGLIGILLIPIFIYSKYLLMGNKRITQMNPDIARTILKKNTHHESYPFDNPSIVNIPLLTHYLKSQFIQLRMFQQCRELNLNSNIIINIERNKKPPQHRPLR